MDQEHPYNLDPNDYIGDASFSSSPMPTSLTPIPLSETTPQSNSVEVQYSNMLIPPTEPSSSEIHNSNIASSSKDDDWRRLRREFTTLSSSSEDAAESDSPKNINSSNALAPPTDHSNYSIPSLPKPTPNAIEPLTTDNPLEPIFQILKNHINSYVALSLPLSGRVTSSEYIRLWLEDYLKGKYVELKRLKAEKRIRKSGDDIRMPLTIGVRCINGKCLKVWTEVKGLEGLDFEIRVNKSGKVTNVRSPKSGKFTSRKTSGTVKTTEGEQSSIVQHVFGQGGGDGDPKSGLLTNDLKKQLAKKHSGR